jgi:hypothetical protein
MKVMFLPHETTLRRYKNIVPQKPGLQYKHLHWMYQQAAKNGIAEKKGGIIFDEMTIQVILNGDKKIK